MNSTTLFFGRLRIVLLALFSFSVHFGSAQNKEFTRLEEQISILSDTVYAGNIWENKVQANEDMIDLLYEILSHPKASRYEFSQLDHVSILKSDRGTMRVITWAIQLPAGEFRYFGFIDYFDRKERVQKVHVLRDKGHLLREPKLATCSPDLWYGCVYYGLVENEYNGEQVYTLLGWDGHNEKSEKKLIEVLWFDALGTPYFGRPMFVSREGIYHREIVEYNELANVRLQYDKKQEVLYTNHLVPVDEESWNVPSCFVPTADHDIYSFVRGKWSLKRAVRDFIPEE